MSEKPIVYKYELKTNENPLMLMSRYLPNGQTVLNRSEWKGHEARSCGITHVGFQKFTVGNEKTIEIEVTYRPKDYVSFVGNTKYIGWNMTLLDKQRDGTLLDGHGKPLPEGESPVYLNYSVHKDVEFDEMEFGDLIGESEIDSKIKISYDEVMDQIQNSSHMSMSINSTFIAQRRSRPSVKIILTSAPGGTGTDGFGTRIVNINKFTPHLTEVILNEMVELMSGFVEGRYSIKNISNGDFVYLDLDDAFVDCTPNEKGEGSRFNCLSEFLPETFIEELAQRLMSTYKVHVRLVEDKKFALILRQETESKKKV